ncbi:tRNA dimethylallyltransferase [Humitalea rosea]|uniref:tRNA dimethylallyltransferase n=1 Tax=Humitalea rosea TaxID=990373 RepID=A0A2W7IWQ9_9PROT|nr:tRNA (adenosine(37)-N6)-dimethylallyltransferase MiaA [Humitalea rosea]PZW50952.1 tRNA dimethylallyltransferase [Humitalea rosea]
MRSALIIMGPTASGKSALALDLARRFGGTVINADSMQVYRELRILTARPTPEEEAMAPHLLYGVRPAAEPGSLAWWRGEALAAMAAAEFPIICGGTGLYISALTQGYADVPPIPEAIRAEARALLAEIGPAALHARLDPATAARLRPTDPQRIARAYEVFRATGRGLAEWQAGPGAGPAPYRFSAILLDPPRDALRAAIATRWQAMMAAGAVEEVEALLALGLDPGLPAMRAHGVPELRAMLAGEIEPAEAARRACLAIGQYTKRQATWARHHDLGPTHRIHARIAGLTQFSECGRSEIFAFIHSRR